MSTPEWADDQLSRDLPVLRSRGESQELEYIESFPQNTRELAKEIAAFSTSNAGTILIGVADSGDLVGLAEGETAGGRDALMSRLEGISGSTVKPGIVPIAKFAIENGRVVLVLTVPEGREPVYYSGSTPYVRHLTQSRPAAPHEVVQLVLESNARGEISVQNDGGNEADEFYAALQSSIVNVLIYADETSERSINPWLEIWRAEFSDTASTLRTLAVEEIATADNLRAELLDVAASLDEVPTFRLYIGGGKELKQLADDASAKTQALLNRLDEAKRLQTMQPDRARRSLTTSSRKLSDLVSRMNELVESGQVKRLQAEASEIGWSLLRVSYLYVSGIDPAALDRLRNIGRKLHLTETMRLTMDGGRSVKRVADRVHKCSEELSTLVSEIDSGGQGVDVAQ